MDAVNWLLGQMSKDGFLLFRYGGGNVAYIKTNFNGRVALFLGRHKDGFFTPKLSLSVDAYPFFVDVLGESDLKLKDDYERNMGFTYWVQTVVFMPDGSTRSVSHKNREKFDVNDVMRVKNVYFERFLPWINRRMNYDFVVNLIENGDEDIIKSEAKDNGRFCFFGWAFGERSSEIDNGLMFKKNYADYYVIMASMAYARQDMEKVGFYANEYKGFKSELELRRQKVS